MGSPHEKGDLLHPPAQASDNLRSFPWRRSHFKPARSRSDLMYATPAVDTTVLGRMLK